MGAVMAEKTLEPHPLLDSLIVVIVHYPKTHALTPAANGVVSGEPSTESPT